MKKLLLAVSLGALLPRFRPLRIRKRSSIALRCLPQRRPAPGAAKGDAAWEPRMAKGMDTLVASVTNGFNAMPPRGMCMDCTAEDYKAIIEWMSTPK